MYFFFFFLLFRSLSLLYLQQYCFFCEKYHFETTSKTEVVIILDLLPTVTVSAVIVFTFWVSVCVCVSLSVLVANCGDTLCSGDNHRSGSEYCARCLYFCLFVSLLYFTCVPNLAMTCHLNSSPVPFLYCCRWFFYHTL